jgi:hypothetical protein
MTKLNILAAVALPLAVQAFAPVAPTHAIIANKPAFVETHLFAEEDNKASEAVFQELDEESVDEDVTFSKAESLGRGAAKVRVSCV